MIKTFRDYRKGELVLVFIDTAGEGSDFNAGQFLSQTYLDVPGVLHYNGSIVDVTPTLKDELERIFDVTAVRPIVTYETNNGGGYELERLSRLNRDNKYEMYKMYKLDSEGKKVRTDKIGFNTNAATRPAMLTDIKDAVDNRLIRIYHKATVNEMFSFIRKQVGNRWRAEAENKSHDDLVMALAGVWQMYQTEEPPKKIQTVTNRPRRNTQSRGRSSFHVN